ncbi:CBS domain-containing protein [Thermomonospora echinospora]|nr:CBS domain-containing protein [Thermomonospora echinospora]
MSAAPIMVPLETTLAEVARLMRDRGIGDVLVTSAGRLCGIVTDRDIVVRAVADGLSAVVTTVGDICSAGPATVRPDDDTAAAAALMRRHAVRRLPVVEGHRTVGIVSIGDLAIVHGDDPVLADISKAPPNV